MELIVSPLPCPGSSSLHMLFLSTQMPLSEPWKRSLGFHSRHSFPSLLPMSYPPGVQAQENLSFKSVSFPPPSSWHPCCQSVPCFSPHQFLTPRGVLAPGRHYLHILVSCLPACPSHLFFHPSSPRTQYFLAPLSLCVQSHLPGMLYPHPAYPSKLSRRIPGCLPATPSMDLSLWRFPRLSPS